MSEISFTFDEMINWESRYRGTLLNLVSGFRPANLIGTRSSEGINNLAVFNSVTHIGANPPHLGFILRPTTVTRHTYNNLKINGFFTINSISTSWTEKAHQTSAKYKENESEFEKTGLHPEFRNDFPAPFVAESSIKIGLSFVEEHLIAVNQTRLIIGKVEQLILPENSIEKDGYMNLEKLKLACIAGLNTYGKPTELKRYPYAEP